MANIIWTKIVSKSLLRLVIENLNKYTIQDKKNKTNAIPITTTRFGPSGSLKSRSSILDKISDVTAKMSNEIFFDLKYIF